MKHSNRPPQWFWPTKAWPESVTRWTPLWFVALFGFWSVLKFTGAERTWDYVLGTFLALGALGYAFEFIGRRRRDAKYDARTSSATGEPE